MSPIPTEGILQERLQLEFCPPLDTVLVAALVADLYMETPTDSAIATLRDTLELLAAQADSDERQATATATATTTDDGDAATESASTSSPPLTTTTKTGGYSTALATTVNGSPKSGSSSASSSAASSTASFSSPLGFLQTAFPDIPAERLAHALAEASTSADPAEDEINIVAVIEDILTQEYIAELDDRGIDAADADVHLPPPQPWIAVGPKKKKRGKPKLHAIAINDIRQQHHVRPAASSGPVGAAGIDAWTAVASLAARMAMLLPPHPDKHFASFFHTPTYRSPVAAARAALQALPARPCTLDHLATLRDMLAGAPELALLDAEARARTLDGDVPLCARAAGGARLDDALQLIWLLRELDDDYERGRWAFGPYHTSGKDEEDVRSPSARAPLSPKSARLPAHPPDIPPPPSMPARRATVSVPTDTWETVPLKLRAAPNEHAAFIPAYTRAGALSTTAPLARETKTTPARANVDDLRRQHAEALLAAGRAWQRGNARNRGGDVARFYADKAHELQARVRAAALDDARRRVAAARTTGIAGATTIDLHFLTVSEAVAVARETLGEVGVAKPLHIITGRGKHSREGKAVLLPAVRAALEEDGWDVRPFSAGITVFGRS